MTYGANIHASSRPVATIPPSQPRNTSERWCGASSLHITFSPLAASHTLECRWQEDPTSSIEYFAMKVMDRPFSDAISLAPFL